VPGAAPDRHEPRPERTSNGASGYAAPRTVAERVADGRYAGSLAGATAAGEASGGERLTVMVGLWLDERGRTVRARYRSTTCASLIACAEAACALLEAGIGEGAIEAARIRSAVKDLHPVHRTRADLVALALARALSDRRHARGAAP
jgi:hypothetical protein